MNGKGLVRESTRRKVAEAVAALNYTPNQEARNLAGSKPIRVGFLYSNPSAGYLSEFLVGLLSQSGLNTSSSSSKNARPGSMRKSRPGT